MEPIGLLFAAFFALIALSILSFWIYDWVKWRRTREMQRRGFEVKPNTGGPPVPLDRKETNNG